MTDENAAAAGDGGNEPVSLRDTITEAYNKAEAANAQPTADPTPEPAQQIADRQRDEHGRFAPAKAAETQQPAPEQNVQPQQQASPQAPQAPAQEENQLEQPAKPSSPPPGWSVAAKAAFDTLPAEVKEAVAKREEEINKGFAKLADYKGLEQFAEMAKQHNTTLPEAVDRYVAAEQFLDRDPAKGILWLMQNYNVDFPALVQAAGGQPTQQQQMPAVDQNNTALQPLLQEIAALKDQLGEFQTVRDSYYGEKRAATESQVEQFFNDPANRYAENVADQMVTLINQARNAGQTVDLKTIYETACFMNPEVRQQLIKEQIAKNAADQVAKAKQTASQARAAGASLTGSPSATPAGQNQTLDLRSQLEAGLAEQMGRA